MTWILFALLFRQGNTKFIFNYSADSLLSFVPPVCNHSLHISPSFSPFPCLHARPLSQDHTSESPTTDGNALLLFLPWTSYLGPCLSPALTVCKCIANSHRSYTSKRNHTDPQSIKQSSAVPNSPCARSHRTKVDVVASVQNDQCSGVFANLKFRWTSCNHYHFLEFPGIEYDPFFLFSRHGILKKLTWMKNEWVFLPWLLLLRAITMQNYVELPTIYVGITSSSVPQNCPQWELQRDQQPGGKQVKPGISKGWMTNSTWKFVYFCQFASFLAELEKKKLLKELLAWIENRYLKISF